MFAGLDDINWEQFGETHLAIGMKTSEIPDCVRNMLHEDYEEREDAIASLLGEGQHLGMMSEATPHIIPYVLEVLAIPGYEQRGYLMMGLGLMFHHMNWKNSFHWLRLYIQVYDEIKKGYPLYKRLLNDTEAYERIFVVRVMVHMQDNSLDALATLLAHLMVETDSDVRAEIIRGMLKLCQDARLFASETWGEVKGIIISLYHYLKDNGTFDEQVHFARAFPDMYRMFFDKAIVGFIDEILSRADSKSGSS